VRQRPYSVVLFDEVEKAHPDVMDILLQILEEGRLTDSFGRKVDFRNTIVIMTSNLGADMIRRTTEVGFGAKSSVTDYATMQEKIESAVKKHYKPEFLNRLDGMVIFRTLSKEMLHHVLKLELTKIQERLAKQDIIIELDDKAIAYLVDKGYEPELGARPLRRVLEQHLEDKLAEEILMHPHPGDVRRFMVSMQDDKLIFTEQDTPKLELAGAGGTVS
jgi:ATP-dependent Clp protease ATP-binding subunit ClpC